MTTIPTALEFLNRDESGVFNEVDITQAMIGFAKLHVEAALQAASQKAKADTEIAHFAEGSYKAPVVDKSTILTSYPLDNIQ